MVELQRDVIRVLAASQSSQKVAADLVPVFTHGTVAQRVVIVWQGERLHEEHGRRVKPALRDLSSEVTGRSSELSSFLHRAVQTAIGAEWIPRHGRAEGAAGKQAVGVRPD